MANPTKKGGDKKIPTQNNIISVIQSITETVLKVYQTIDPKVDKDTKTVDSKALKKALKKARADFDEVIKAVIQFEQMKAQIDITTAAIVELISTPNDIDTRIRSVKVPNIKTDDLERAVQQLCLVLNTPEEINQLLNKPTPNIKTRKLDKAVKSIEYTLELPGRINDIIGSKNVASVDTSSFQSVQDSIESVFGPNGFIKKINDYVDGINFRTMKFRMLGFKSYLNNIESMLKDLAQFNADIRGTVPNMDVNWTEDLIGILNKLSDTAQEISKIKLKDGLLIGLRLKILNHMLHKLGKFANDINSLGAADIQGADTTIKIIKDVLADTLDIVNTANKFKIVALTESYIKISGVTIIIQHIANDLLPKLSELASRKNELADVIAGLKLLQKVFKQLEDIFKIIKNITIAQILMTNIKANLLRKSARRISVLVTALALLAKEGSDNKAALSIGLAVVYTALAIFGQIIGVIRSIKRGLFFNRKVRLLIMSTRLIRVLLRRIADMADVRGIKRAAVNMAAILILLEGLKAVILAILILTPIMALFLLASPIIILVTWAFHLVFMVIVKLLAKILTPKMFIIFVALTGIVYLMVLLGLGLLVLGMITLMIKDMLLSILGFFVFIIVMSVLLALAGMVLGYLVPFMAPMLIAMGLIAAMVLVVILIAGMLWLLGEIKLDEKKIQENVKKIMDTVLMIITSLFESDINDPEGRDSVFTKILKVLGGAVAKIAMAFATCIILVATVVSVACILLIAVMLWMLSKIKLDENKILSNVDTVFNICENIINRIVVDDEKDSKKSNRGILLKIINWACPGMAKIVEALLSLAYVFLMFVAVSLVLGIAGMLRLIQIINLDEKKIMKNVDTIFNICDEIINRIFAPRSDKKNPSNRGILATIISWVDEGLAKIFEAALTIVYLALIMVAIMIVLGIAGLLRAIQAIDLNYDEITSRVKTIFDTCDMIISRVFAPQDDQENPSNRGILATIISWVDEGLAKVYEAALTIVYLALIMVAIMIVLGIAGLLRAIQAIDLNYDEITSRVKTIFDTCDMIISRVFAPADDSTQSHDGLFGKIIGFFSPELKDIIDALMAVTKLAMVFMAISVVKGIAKELNTIQNIEIDDNAIDKKVDAIFKSASACMHKVYAKADDLLPEPKKKGIFRAIIGFFSPGLGSILDALTTIQKLAVVHAAISAVAGIGKALDEINKIPTDLTAAGTKVGEIMDVASKICTRIFSTEADIKFPVPPEEEKSVWGALCSFFFGGKSDQERALEAAMQKVEQLGVICGAVGALGEIQLALKEIMDANFENFTGASEKVEQLMGIASSVSEVIFGSDYKLTLPEPTEDETKSALIDMGWSSLKKWLWGDKDAAMADAKKEAAMKLAMHRVETLALIASSVGSLKTIMDGMNAIKNFDEKSVNVNALKAKIQSIMQASAAIAFTIFNSDNIGSSGGNAAGIKGQIEDVKARIDFRNAAVTGTSTLGANFKKLIESTTYSEEDISRTKSRLSSGIRAMDEIISMVDSITPTNGGDNVRNNCDLLDRISKTAHSFVKVEDRDVKNARDITDNYIKFLQQVEKTDFAKLEHTDYMMRAWASISKDLRGDFEGLSKTINQHIQPMLTKLNETMEKVNACQKSIIQELTKPVSISSDGSTMTFGTPTTADTTTTPTGGDGLSLGKAETGSVPGSSTTTTNNNKPQTRETRRPTTQQMLQKGRRYKVAITEVEDLGNI